MADNHAEKHECIRGYINHENDPCATCDGASTNKAPPSPDNDVAYCNSLRKKSEDLRASLDHRTLVMGEAIKRAEKAEKQLSELQQRVALEFQPRIEELENIICRHVAAREGESGERPDITVSYLYRVDRQVRERKATEGSKESRVGDWVPFTDPYTQETLYQRSGNVIVKKDDTCDFCENEAVFYNSEGQHCGRVRCQDSARDDKPRKLRWLIQAIEPRECEPDNKKNV